ncbi:MAG: MFS transporter [Elusimicrobia bacterium]|nr:MFS transporter [Elusimicrobiota bacterium]
MKKLWPLFVCLVVLVGGIALSFPFFALYLHHHKGIPMGWVGFFLFLSVVAGACSSAIGGELSDHWGRKRVMVFSLFLSCVVTLGMAFAIWKNVPAGWLILIHIVRSFLGQAFDPTARGWVADQFPSHQRARAYSFLRTAHNLGWAIGPALGGFLAESSYFLLFLLTGTCIFFCWIWILMALPDQSIVGTQMHWRLREMWLSLKDPRFSSYLIYVFFLGALMGQLITTFSVHAFDFVHVSERQIGLLFSLNGACVVCLQVLATRFLTRWRLTHCLAWGSLIYAVGFCGVGFATTFWHLAIAVIIVTLGEVSVSPSLPTLAANLAPAPIRGRYIGMQGLAHMLGWAMGPLVGGWGLQTLSVVYPWLTWVLLSCLGVAAARGFWTLQKDIQESEDGLLVEVVVPQGAV